AVRLLLAAGVRRLFCRVFRPLAAPLGAVDDQPRVLPGSRLTPGKLPGVALREDAQFIEGLAQAGQQPVDPIIGPRLAYAEEFAQDGLQRIGLEIDEQEQQLLFPRRAHLDYSLSNSRWRR